MTDLNTEVELPSATTSRKDPVTAINLLSTLSTTPKFSQSTSLI